VKFRLAVSLCTLVLCVPQVLFAQGFVENALLFSRTQPNGSARIQALGGSQIALGGDYSSALSNPAGLGMFNRSEVTFTPALNFAGIESIHFGTGGQNTSTYFNIPGVSIVSHKPGFNQKFPGSTLAVTVTRTNSFNNQFSFSGTDNISSITDWFIERANGFAPEQLPAPHNNIPLLNFEEITGQAYLTYLINTFADDPGNASPVMPDDYINYYSELEALPGETRTLNRTGNVTTRGAQYQWSVAYGGNYQDKLFFGASLGIATLRYDFERQYREDSFVFSDDPSYNPLNYLSLSEKIRIEGSGVNFTLGFIYRATDNFQLGASLVTPTWYQLTDTYTSSVTAAWNDSRGTITEQTLQPLTSEYSLRTPWRTSLGMAWFFAGRGFISVDAEWLNFGQARYTSQVGGISFDPENTGIRQQFKSVMNYRLGGELRLNMWRLRAGFNYQANPLVSSAANYRIATFSTGAGIRLKKFYTDLTFLHSNDRPQYSPFVFFDGTGPAVKQTRNVTTLLVTFGFTF